MRLQFKRYTYSDIFKVLNLINHFNASMVDTKPKVTKEVKKNDGEQKVQPIGPTDAPARHGFNAYKVLGSRFELPD